MKDRKLLEVRLSSVLLPENYFISFHLWRKHKGWFYLKAPPKKKSIFWKLKWRFRNGY